MDVQRRHHNRSCQHQSETSSKWVPTYQLISLFWHHTTLGMSLFYSCNQSYILTLTWSSSCFHGIMMMFIQIWRWRCHSNSLTSVFFFFLLFIIICSINGNGSGSHFELWQEDVLHLCDLAAAHRASVQTLGAVRTTNKVTTWAKGSVNISVHTHTTHQFVLDMF